MKYSHIYIKSVDIKNVRTFENAAINFEKEDGTLPQWTLILGDNAIGKTTILQSVAWMKPLVHDLKDDLGDKIKKKDIEPVINNEDNSTLERLVNRNGFLNAQINAVYVADCILGKKNTANENKSCKSEILIKLDDKRELEDVKMKFNTDFEDIFFKNEVVIYPYSASRRIGRSNIYDSEQEDLTVMFNAEDTQLYDVEEVLHTLNYASLGADKKESAKYKKYLSKVIVMLLSVLPEYDDVQKVEIATPKLVGNVIKPGEVLLTTKHGIKIPYSNLSLGYKSIISLTVDLSWRLINKYPESPNPLKEAAIVLIDEIDSHLHPLWQREIIQKLSSHFPNVQFIATAHSPLIVQAAMDANYEILKSEGNVVLVINDTENVDGWRIDQILTSDFFGLSTSRGPEIQKKIDQRRELLKLQHLDNSQKAILKKLNAEIYELPVGETKQEIEAMDVLRNFSKELEALKLKENDKIN